MASTYRNTNDNPWTAADFGAGSSAFHDTGAKESDLSIFGAQGLADRANSLGDYYTNKQADKAAGVAIEYVPGQGYQKVPIGTGLTGADDINAYDGMMGDQRRRGNLFSPDLDTAGFHGGDDANWYSEYTADKSAADIDALEYTNTERTAWNTAHPNMQVALLAGQPTPPPSTPTPPPPTPTPPPPTPTPPTPTAPTGQPLTPTNNNAQTQVIDPNTMTVEGRLAGLLDPSNPLMQRAATQGMQYANSRGLLNSSIGAEAAQNAMIDQGIKIAGPDAETYFKQQGLNQDYTFRYDELGEKVREFDVGADQWQQGFNEDVRQFGLNFGENARQFDVGSDQWQQNFDEGVRQYGQDFNERTRQFDVGSDQWQQNFDEGVRQYGQDFMEDVREFDEGIREYDNNFDENSRQFDDNLQWLRDNSGEELDFRYDEMDNDNKKAFIGVVGDARSNFDAYVSSLMLDPDLSADDIQGLTDTAFTSLQSYIDLSAAYLGADISWAPSDDVATDTPAVPLTQDNYVEVAQGFAAKGWAIDDITRYFKESGVTKQQALAAFSADPASVASINSVYGEDGLLELDVTPSTTNITDDPTAYALAQLNAGVPIADIISTMKDAGVSYATMHNYPGASQEWRDAVEVGYGVHT